MKRWLINSLAIHQWRLWSIYPDRIVAMTELSRISSGVTQLTFYMPWLTMHQSVDGAAWRYLLMLVSMIGP